MEGILDGNGKDYSKIWPLKNKFNSFSVKMNQESAFLQWRKRISTGMDQILPGLYVGSLRDAVDVKMLDENKIRAIVSVHGFSKNCDFGGAKVEVLRVVLNDSPGENVLKYFPSTNSFIHSHRLRQENVLVHCLAGASRSVCICVAYLMTVTNLSYSNALEYIGQRRYCARPNFGFKMQLMKFGEKYIAAERQRLFGEFSQNDRNGFIKLHRDDCLFTNSLFVEEAKQAEMHFSIVENGSSEQNGSSRRSNKKSEEIVEIGEGVPQQIVAGSIALYWPMME